MASYALERWTWSDAEFERMGWHDSQVHAIAFLPEVWQFALDLDYILEWVAPSSDEFYRFWVAPATLIFENATDVQIELEPYGDVTVQDLRRDDPRPSRPGFEGPSTHWRWVLECNEGEIRLRASGFRQFIRRAPVFTREQSLSLEARGGLSFDQVANRAPAG